MTGAAVVQYFKVLFVCNDSKTATGFWGAVYSAAGDGGYHQGCNYQTPMHNVTL